MPIPRDGLKARWAFARELTYKCLGHKLLLFHVFNFYNLFHSYFHVLLFFFVCVEMLSLVECGHRAYKVCDFIILFVQISDYSNLNKKSLLILG